MDRTEATTLTNMCMIVDGDKVLTIDRLDPFWPGLAFPGGHIERHESFHDSVVREVKEETNLDIVDPRLVGFKQFFDQQDRRYLVFFYRADKFSGTVRSSREGRLEWVKISDLPKRQLAYNFDRDLEVFLNSDIDEHLLLNEKDFLY
ncbi:7,8-dihydro-8-oxoguanine triphosphatase [Lactobacillus nasalidis]|uniref:7,8-dihydro-8-oxoguanine triphosphatase n=1 Tax=Lactobacillus nasalidis TaxID=2797258 RepID=A0ABQ3W4F9_9LACO|nr:8-oxo-dGTP diphosphatase [Lactobacillus nasalidis]GHV97138.1 7,8-dihydro-8-oxoguanine triphosphatase [Lactobacillus nasalidis]GHV99125.1 7,8-dihydro-8-oxoguanine triphosphatase [Lactobacillus nasalidis]GHW01403.1 7,8-dihydro-8-oxoguanine triphosphatase [Lactobacillus nasalidis]